VTGFAEELDDPGGAGRVGGVVWEIVWASLWTAGWAARILSLRRTAGLIEVFCPVLRRQLRYVWNAGAE
jgi:hypothetical protein